MISNKPISKRGKAWPKHKPGRKETGGIALKNRVHLISPDDLSVKGFLLMPLKRKYKVYRANMQSPVASPAQPPKNKNRPFFPMGRIRAIKSPLAS